MTKTHPKQNNGWVGVINQILFIIIDGLENWEDGRTHCATQLKKT